MVRYLTGKDRIFEQKRESFVRLAQALYETLESFLRCFTLQNSLETSNIQLKRHRTVQHCCQTPWNTSEERFLNSVRFKWQVAVSPLDSVDAVL